MKMDVAEAKRRLRAEARARREAVHREMGADAGGRFARQFFSHAPLKTGMTVAAYLAMGSEADPGGILDALPQHGCRSALAAMISAGIKQGARLEFSLWRKGEALVPGPYGTRHPAHILPVLPDIILVPLLAFDARGQRLGYGGGHYDRALGLIRARPEGVEQGVAGPPPLPLALGLAFAAQEVDRLPCEPTDQPLDGIVTESGVRFFGRLES